MEQQGNGRAFLGEEQAHESEMWTEMVFDDPEGNKERKALASQKEMKANGTVDFARFK